MGRKRNSVFDKAYELYVSEFMSCQDLGKVLGISRQSVMKAFKRRGYKLRDKSQYWEKHLKKSQ